MLTSRAVAVGTDLRQDSAPGPGEVAWIALGEVPGGRVRHALQTRRGIETDPTVKGELDRVLR